MQRRHVQRRSRRIFNLGSKTRAVILFVLGAGLLVLLAGLLRPSSQLLNMPEIAAVKRRGVLRAGVRTDVAGFAENGEGLEVALARALAKRIFPELDPSASLELVPVNAYTSLPKLKSGTIDIAFALLRNTGDKAYAYSGAYYSDPIFMLVKRGDENAALKNRRVGLIDLSAAAFALKQYNEANSAELEACYYASYPDLITALKNGAVDFVAIPGAFVEGYVDDEIKKSGLMLGSISYVAVSDAESPAFALLTDTLISQMQKDGTLKALILKYGLHSEQSA